MPRKKTARLPSLASPAIYAEHLERLGLSQVSGGRLFNASARTGQRWAVAGPPLAVVMVLSLHDDPEEIKKLAYKVSGK